MPHVGCDLFALTLQVPTTYCQRVHILGVGRDLFALTIETYTYDT